MRQTLLFGDEKGQEMERSREFAAFLDAAKPDAVPLYRERLRQHFELRHDDPLPNHRGRLMYYPTYFDRIDVEVINPHSRETKAGTLPIYLESVPAGATGVFSLLYVPFDCIGQDEAKTRAEVAADLPLVAEALQAMLTTYGFGAKTSSGFGVARPALAQTGYLHMHGRATPYEFHALAKLADRTSLVAAARDAARDIAQEVTA